MEVLQAILSGPGGANVVTLVVIRVRMELRDDVLEATKDVHCV
jgi:hypothetical protein